MSYPRVPVIRTPDWERRAAEAVNHALTLTDAPEIAAADIADVGSTINTRGKFAGRLVWDATNTRMMRASGRDAGDAWSVIDGSASVTPA